MPPAASRLPPGELRSSQQPKLAPSKVYTSAALCKRSVSSLADRVHTSSSFERTFPRGVKHQHHDMQSSDAIHKRRSKSTEPIADPYIPRTAALNFRKCPPNCPCQLTHQLPHLSYGEDSQDFYAEWMDAENRAKQRYLSRVAQRSESTAESPTTSQTESNEIPTFSQVLVSVKNDSKRELLPSPTNSTNPNTATTSTVQELGLAEPIPLPLPKLHGMHRLMEAPDPILQDVHEAHEPPDSESSPHPDQQSQGSPGHPDHDSGPSLPAAVDKQELLMPAPRRRSISPKRDNTNQHSPKASPKGVKLHKESAVPELGHVHLPMITSSSSPKHVLQASTSQDQIELRSTDLSSSPLLTSPINRRDRGGSGVSVSAEHLHGGGARPRFSSMHENRSLHLGASERNSAKDVLKPHADLVRMGTNRRLSTPEGKFAAAAPFLLQRRRSSVTFTSNLKRPAGQGARKGERPYAIPKLSTLGLDDSSNEISLEGRSDLMRADRMTTLSQAVTAKRILRISVSHMPLGQQGVDLMQPVFKNLAHLEHVEVKKSELHAFGATSLGNVLGKIRALQTLEIARNAIGSRGLKALLHGIRHVHGLRRLGLAGNLLGDEGVGHLGASLRATQAASVVEDEHTEKRPFGVSLTALDLHDNGIGPDGCISLFGALVGLDLCTQLQELDMSNNPLTCSGSDFSGIQALRGSLRQMTSISDLNLDNTKLSTEGGIMVVEGLVYKEKAMQQQVRAFWRQLGAATNLLIHERRELEAEALKLEQQFRKYTLERPLKILNLGHNVLGMEGMRAIGEAKGLFACLTTLNIGSNEMTGNTYNPTFDGTVKLTDSLKVAKNLTFLNVSDNRISTESGDETCLPTLCESLYLLQRLTYLDISTNNIGPTGAKVFAGSLASLRSLQYLDVSDNGIESQGMKDLVPALRGTLTDLNLSSNDIGPDGVSALTNQLPSLTSMTRLDLSQNRLSHAFSMVERTPSPTPDAIKPASSGSGSTAMRSPPRTGGGQRLPRKNIGFKDVASKMSISHGEVRKLALMTADMEGGLKRGYTLFAQACGIHLVNIKTIVISVTIDGGTVRNDGPTLNLASGNYGQEDVIIIGELLKHNSSLTAVDLSNNDLTHRGSDLRGMEVLSEWLLQAEHLLELDLSHVFLTDGGATRVARGLGDLTQLETLKLKGNLLTSGGALAMSVGVASLSSLSHLDISENPLGFVDREVDRWRVEEALETFSLALTNCVRLKVLDIRECLLGDDGGRAIALALCYLTELEHLYISGNDIQEQGQEEIGSAIRQCKQVEVTDDIKMPMPDEQGRMVWALGAQIKAVYQVSLISNCIRRAQFVSLDLSSNHIGKNKSLMKDLAESFSFLDNLQDLNISENGPFSVEVCRELSKSLQHMTTLRTLRLADNAIGGDGADAIMCTIVRLPKLKELDIRNNRFKYFPVALPHSCPELLVRIEVSGNPWLCPSEDVMSRNTFQIREHLSALFMEGTRDKDIALGLLGQQLVGKTSLLEALMSPTSTARHIAVNQRTKGVAFAHWQPTGKSGPNFTAYDFAGMMLYRDLHHKLFLPRRALYCLVWRPFSPIAGLESATHYRVRSKGNVTRTQLKPLLAEQVTGWLIDMYQRVPGCTVLLVGTHADPMMPEEELSWQSTQVENAARARLNKLNYEFPNLQPLKLLLGPSGSIPMVSCRSGNGIEDLRAHIIASATALPFFGEFLPRPWVLVRQKFLSQERKEDIESPVAPTKKKESVAAGVDARRRLMSIQSDDGLGAPVNDEQLYGVSASGPAPEAADMTASPRLIHEGSHLSQEGQPRLTPETSFVSQEGEAAPNTSPVALSHDKASRSGDIHRPGTMGGFLWIGHFKRIAKDCGVEDCQVMELLRYLHDSCVLRCFAFDEGPESWRQGNETHGGFEELEPYRSAGFKIATNSRQRLMEKTPPYGMREQAWGNLLDTVIVDVPWLAGMITSVVDCSPGQALSSVRDNLSPEGPDLPELEEAVWALHKEGLLRGKPEGGSKTLRELWTKFIPAHDIRRLQNLLEGRNVLQYRKERMYVPALKRREGTPSMAGQAALFVSSDRNPSVVNNKEQNMARPWAQLLSRLLNDVLNLQVRQTNRNESEDVARETVASCGAFIMVVTDSYFRSRTCTTELSLALEMAMPIIPIILPQYSLWPPAVKDGCWWEDHGIPHIDNLFLADAIDLSSAPFHDLLDTLLETTPMVESRTGSVAGSTASSDDLGMRRWSLMDEAPGRWGIMDAIGDGPTPPSSSGPPQKPDVVADPVPNVREVLQEMKQRVEARLEEARLDASPSAALDEGDLEAAHAELDAAYDELCRVVEAALHTISSAASQTSWFPVVADPDGQPEEIALHHHHAAKVRTAFDAARIKFSLASDQKKEDRIHREAARLSRDEDARRKAMEDFEAHRVNAELWQRDPLHAKITILHNVANIHRGLGVEPRWQEKEQILARAEEMARHPSMFDPTHGLHDPADLRRCSSSDLPNGDQTGASPLGGEGARDGQELDEEGARDGAEEEGAEGEDGEEGGEGHQGEEGEGREPLFDLLLTGQGPARVASFRQHLRGGSAHGEEIEEEEEELDLTLTLGMEQHAASLPKPPDLAVFSVDSDAVSVPASLPQTPSKASVPPTPTAGSVPPTPKQATAVAASDERRPSATDGIIPSGTGAAEDDGKKPEEPQLTFEERRALAREKGRLRAKERAEREAARAKEEEAAAGE